MSLLFHKNFSDALTGANGFDSVSASNGTIVQSAGAGLNSTSGGVTITATGSSPSVFGQISASLTGKTSFRVAFWVDLENVTIGTDNHFTRLYTHGDANNNTHSNELFLQKLSGVIYLRHIARNDAGSAITENIDLTTDFPQWIELWGKKSSGPGVADAEAYLYLGGGDYDPLGELVSSLTGWISYTRFEDDLQRVGFHQGQATIGGSLLFDEWSMRDDDEPILFGVSENTSPALLYLRRRRRD